jgi:hypothetical protein
MKKRALVFLAALTLLAALAVPASVSAQREGRWRHNSEWSRQRRMENRGARRRVVISSRYYNPNNRYRVVRGRRIIIRHR